jgi:molybdopterin/thiamine biosynthesis adenylyltransferase
MINHTQAKILIERHSRHVQLNKFGSEALNRFQKAKVLIVGCGGLGTPVTQYLVAAGVGNITLCDDDTIEYSNLNRQTLFQLDSVGKHKNEVLKHYISEFNPDVKVELLNERVTFNNIEQLFKAHDLIIDCTDGLPNKLLLNDAAVLFIRPMIHGAATAFCGRMLLYLPQHGCLRCLFPELSTAVNLPSCQSLGILGPVCGVVGSLMAVEALKLINNNYISNSTNQYFLIDCQHETNINKLSFRKSSDCPICGECPQILGINRENYNLTLCGL